MLIRRHHVIAFLALGMLLALSSVAAAQDPPTSLVTTANGEGKIKLGKEEYKLHAIVVKLFQDGKAEINLITDITVFIEGTWSRGSEADKTIDLKITGNSMSGNLNGGGKLFLTEDRKSIAGLKLQALNKTSKKTVTADFVSK
jgi:hypothetical protein